MENQLDKAEPVRKYQIYTKKIEGALSVFFLILFFQSFTSSIFSFYSIAFYGLGFITFIYYFVWFRKKPAYLAIEGESIRVTRNIFFKTEEIGVKDIKKVEVKDKKIEILYQKEGTGARASIYNILLDKKDKDEIAKYLKELIN